MKPDIPDIRTRLAFCKGYSKIIIDIDAQTCTFESRVKSNTQKEKDFIVDLLSKFFNLEKENKKCHVQLENVQPV